MSKQAVVVNEKVYIVDTDTGTKTPVSDPSIINGILDGANSVVGGVVDGAVGVLGSIIDTVLGGSKK